jgi:hypothetical protein
VKYWEIIADNRKKAGWRLLLNLKYGSRGPTIWVVVAEREKAERFIVHADEKLTAFMELESAIRACSKLS